MAAYNWILALLVVGVATADVALGAIVLQRNGRSFTHRCFAAAAAALALWLVANYLSDQVTADHARLLFLNRLTVAAGVTAGALLFAFVLSFPHREARMTAPWQRQDRHRQRNPAQTE